MVCCQPKICVSLCPLILDNIEEISHDQSSKLVEFELQLFSLIIALITTKDSFKNAGNYYF